MWHGFSRLASGFLAISICSTFMLDFWVWTFIRSQEWENQWFKFMRHWFWGSDAESRCERVHRQVGELEGMLPTTGPSYAWHMLLDGFGVVNWLAMLIESSTLLSCIALMHFADTFAGQGASQTGPSFSQRGPDLAQAEPRSLFNFEGACRGLSPGGRRPTFEPIGHFFDQSRAAGTALAGPGSPKQMGRSMRGLNSAFFGSARLSRRRIT